MSIIDVERNTGFAPASPERIGDQVERGNGLSFAEAAELSRGQYDTDEQHAERLELARHLQETMVPGASVLHKASSLDVRGGTLIEAPDVIMVPCGDDFELAISYRLDAGLDEHTGFMTFNSLIAGTRPGFTARDYANIPVLVAGHADVSAYALQTYAQQRNLEESPGGVPWNDMSPLTEIRTYAALQHTSVRMADVLPKNETHALRERLLADIDNPALKHLVPDNFWALVGIDDTGTDRLQEEIYERHARAERQQRHRRTRRVLGWAAGLLTRI